MKAQLEWVQERIKEGNEDRNIDSFFWRNFAINQGNSNGNMVSM